MVACLAAWCLTAGSPARAADPRAVAIWVPGEADGLAARQIAFLVKRIEERLPRHFAFEIETGAACPPESELMAQIRSGRIDIAVVGDALIDEVPRLALFRIPWLFTDRNHVQRALYAGLEDEIRSHVEAALPVVVVGIYQNAFRQFRADKAVAAPEDLADRRILVDEGRTMRDFWRSLGAVPQKVPPADAAAALDKGIVDSFDGRLEMLLRLPIGDKAPVITLTRHVYEPTFVLASHAFWSSLSNAERGALGEIGVDFADTAAHLSASYEEGLVKRLPRRLRLAAMATDRFAPITAQQRAAYEKAFGSDWLDFVDMGRDATEVGEAAAAPGD